MPTPRTHPKIIGHRGAMAAHPENTLPGIEGALEQGVDGIEIDIWRHESGRLLVFHDETLERTTDGSGALMTTPFDALRALDAGGGARIPLLEEVLALTDGRCELNIELKGPGTARALASFLEQHPTYDRASLLLSSFKVTELEIAMARMPDLRRGVLVVKPNDEAFAEVARLKAFSLHPSARHTTEATIERARDLGVEVYAWTVNDEQTSKQLAAWNVDALITDSPDRLRAYVLDHAD